MKIQHLRYIVMIADQRSISLAAKKLYVSQPYLSKVVQDIEADFGKKIFERKPQGIALTAEGKQLRPGPVSSDKALEDKSAEQPHQNTGGYAGQEGTHRADTHQRDAEGALAEALPEGQQSKHTSQG